MSEDRFVDDSDFLEQEEAAPPRDEAADLPPMFAKMAPNDPRRLMLLAIKAHIGCEAPTMFIRRRDKRMVSTKAFNMRHNRIVNMIEGVPTRYEDAAANFAIASPAFDVVDGVCFRPGHADVTSDDKFNMWVDPKVKPLPGKPTIFLDHMEYLIPDKIERKLVLDWLAWLVQHPDKKLMFAMLIVGPGGTGKSWVGKLMEVILGEANAKLFERDDVLSDTFNAFSENAQLVFLHEVAPDPTGKRDVVSMVKGLITESHVWINKKNIERFRIENFANLMGISNHPERIKMLRNDRRWAVAQGASDVRFTDDRDEATDKTKEYYARLWSCIGTPAAPGDEARRVLAWLMARDLTSFDGVGLAPITTAKEDVAAGGEESVMAQVATMHRERSGPFKFGLVTVAEVMGVVSCGKGDEESFRAEIAAAMQAIGCRPVKIDGRVPQLRVGTAGKAVRLWATSRKLATKFSAMDVSQLSEAYKQYRSKGDWED